MSGSIRFPPAPANTPGAAASLREGLEETLTLQRLGLTDALYRTLRITSAIEHLNGPIGRYARNVKRWRDGYLVWRWVGCSAAARGVDSLSPRPRLPRASHLIAALATLEKETKKAA